MPKNHFYEKKGPFPLKEIVKTIGYTGNFSSENNFQIHGLESLIKASKNKTGETLLVVPFAGSGSECVAAKKENIDPYILTSIIYTESRFRPNAVSSAGACGLTQVIPKYSVGKLTCKQLKNPKTSIYAGAASLNQWIKKRGKKKYKEALACYNAGNKCLKSSHGKRYATIVVNLADKLRKIAATKKEPVRFEYYPLDLIHPLESTHQECYATVKD